MKIERYQRDKELELKLEGRLDAATAPELDNEIRNSEDITKLIMDFSELQYISSAGLRILLTAQKMMNKKSSELILKNVNSDVMEVFDITGFSDILTIQ